MIGREKEFKILNELYLSKESQFVAVCGRRRIGKTYLVDETFVGRITFRHSGLSPVESRKKNPKSPLAKQLQHFYNSLISQGAVVDKCPKDWLEAFLQLELYLQSIDDGTRQLVFLDELPWMDTPKSGFVTALEAFWNNWACHRKNFILIVCGSATSWMNDKLINNKGGLYGRLTYRIFLKPFSLRECERFFESKNIHFSRYDTICAYMACGGIPYYLNYFSPGYSLAQNLDDLFFAKNAFLKDEFNLLFNSIFTNGDFMKNLVETMGKKRIGCTRGEIISSLKLSSGGELTVALDSLVASDFILKYLPLGSKRNEERYKLIDPFCIFYLKFMNGKSNVSEDFWSKNLENQSIVSWRGIAFENVCFNHVKQIKSALEIGDVSSEQYAWSKFGDEEEGLQIDMVIKRKDNVANMCEIKFYSSEVAVDKKMDLQIRSRSSALKKELPKNFAVMSTLITTHGLKKNEYYWSFSKVITMEDLFRE